jgi:hypothetical protein
MGIVPGSRQQRGNPAASAVAVRPGSGWLCSVVAGQVGRLTAASTAGWRCRLSSRSAPGCRSRRNRCRQALAEDMQGVARSDGPRLRVGAVLAAERDDDGAAGGLNGAVLRREGADGVCRRRQTTWKLCIPRKLFMPTACFISTGRKVSTLTAAPALAECVLNNPQSVRVRICRFCRGGCPGSCS